MNVTVAGNNFKDIPKGILPTTTIKLGKVLEKFIYDRVIAIVPIR